MENNFLLQKPLYQQNKNQPNLNLNPNLNVPVLFQSQLENEILDTQIEDEIKRNDIKDYIQKILSENYNSDLVYEKLQTLSQVKGYIELLANEFDNASDEKKREMVFDAAEEYLFSSVDSMNNQCLNKYSYELFFRILFRERFSNYTNNVPINTYGSRKNTFRYSYSNLDNIKDFSPHTWYCVAIIMDFFGYSPLDWNGIIDSFLVYDKNPKKSTQEYRDMMIEKFDALMIFISTIYDNGILFDQDNLSISEPDTNSMSKINNTLTELSSLQFDSKLNVQDFYTYFSDLLFWISTIKKLQSELSYNYPIFNNPKDIDKDDFTFFRNHLDSALIQYLGKDKITQLVQPPQTLKEIQENRTKGNLNCNELKRSKKFYVEGNEYSDAKITNEEAEKILTEISQNPNDLFKSDMLIPEFVDFAVSKELNQELRREALKYTSQLDLKEKDILIPKKTIHYNPKEEIQITTTNKNQDYYKLISEWYDIPWSDYLANYPGGFFQSYLSQGFALSESLLPESSFSTARNPFKLCKYELFRKNPHYIVDVYHFFKNLGLDDRYYYRFLEKLSQSSSYKNGTSRELSDKDLNTMKTIIDTLFELEPISMNQFIHELDAIASGNLGLGNLDISLLPIASIYYEYFPIHMYNVMRIYDIYLLSLDLKNANTPQKLRDIQEDISQRMQYDTLEYELLYHPNE